MSDDKKITDEVTGVETTGHDWDGIKELNNPAPRWWLIVWLVCTIWGVGYWFFYPAWPTFSGEGERGGTVGSLNWTQYTQLQEQQAEIMARKAAYLSKFEVASFDDVMTDESLYSFAIAGGKSAFKDNCATCHGSGGAGAPGYPNLNDDDWIWGGSVDDIHTTISYGIRSEHDDTRLSDMPPFGDMLSAEEINAVAKFVVSKDDAGATVFSDNCASCHGDNARGIQEMGAPDLKDAIWLYASSENDVRSQIRKPKHGMMPAWTDRLDAQTVRQLAVYVHSLGGGK